MNKQEALVDVLAACRGFEQPHEEVQRVSDNDVWRQMKQGVAWLRELAGDRPVGHASRPSPEARERLARIAGAALYLLVDEVEIVAGRTLEAWLADKKLTGHVISSWGGAVIAQVQEVA